jgi:hypothetical protein
MTPIMQIETIDTSSDFVPFGRLFIATQNVCGNGNVFLNACLESDEFSSPMQERVEVELNQILGDIGLIIQDLENSKKESKLITKLRNINSACSLSHDPKSAGGSFLIRCLNGLFYINWHRES